MNPSGSSRRGFSLGGVTSLSIPRTSTATGVCMCVYVCVLVRIPLWSKEVRVRIVHQFGEGARCQGQIQEPDLQLSPPPSPFSFLLSTFSILSVLFESELRGVRSPVHSNCSVVFHCIRTAPVSYCTVFLQFVSHFAQVLLRLHH